MEIPLSIIITTYNRKDILKRCLNSIRAQNYKNVEIIVVDDNSQPSYKQEIIKEFPEVKYIYQNKNTGPSVARNNGISIARNNYVVIMDDDDIFKPSAFHTINDFLSDKKDLGFPIYNFLRSNAKLKYKDNYRVYSFSEMIDGAISGDLVPVINRKYFTEKNQYSYPNSRIGAESLLWYEITINHGFPIINEIIVELLDDADVRLTDVSRQVLNASFFAEYQINIIQRFKEEILKTNNKDFLINKYMGAIAYLLISGKEKESFNILKELLYYSKKHVVILPLFLLPKKIIIHMFYLYRKIWKRVN